MQANLKAIKAQRCMQQKQLSQFPTKTQFHWRQLTGFFKVSNSVGLNTIHTAILPHTHKYTQLNPQLPALSEAQYLYICVRPCPCNETSNENVDLEETFCNNFSFIRDSTLSIADLFPQTQKILDFFLVLHNYRPIFV